MARTTSFTKRSLITKANSTIVVATTVAAFVFVFTLVAGQTLVSQVAYQNRVISAKKEALEQLREDLNARDSLEAAYKAFVAEKPNVLGGLPEGTGEKDGDNARLVLDALPSKYDFPALATSLEKIITGQGLAIEGISGTDEEAIQQENQISPTPEPIEMPFTVEVNGTYVAIQNLVGVFQRSIRPFQIQALELTGEDSNMQATITAKTFYQPEKSLEIRKEVVR